MYARPVGVGDDTGRAFDVEWQASVRWPGSPGEGWFGLDDAMK
jgi:hypothetical protein